MPRPDEGIIHAWLDGELAADEAERVAKLVAEDAEWGAAAAEARGLIAASLRIVSALDAVPAGVMPAGSRAAPMKKPRFTVKPWMRMAAGMVLVVGTATAVWTRTANAPTTQVAEGERNASSPVGTTVAGGADVAREAEAVATAASPARAEAMQLRRNVSAESSSDLAMPTLSGCWRTQVIGRPDSVLTDPGIARQSGDTITIVVAADGRTATVRRDGDDVVRGQTQLGSTAPVAFIGTRVTCPRTP